MEHNYSVATENKYSFFLGDGEESGDLEDHLAALKLDKEKEKKESKKKGKPSNKTGIFGIKFLLLGYSHQLRYSYSVSISRIGKECRSNS